MQGWCLNQTITVQDFNKWKAQNTQKLVVCDLYVQKGIISWILQLGQSL